MITTIILVLLSGGHVVGGDSRGMPQEALIQAVLQVYILPSLFSFDKYFSSCQADRRRRCPLDDKYSYDGVVNAIVKNKKLNGLLLQRS